MTGHHTGTSSMSSSMASAAQSSSELFRRLNWQSAIPLEIRLADGEPGAGSSCDRYYVSHLPDYLPFTGGRSTTAAPHAYLALLIPEIRENLVELALDDQQLADTNEANWWFEDDGVGGGESGESRQDQTSSPVFAPQGPCRWHWPLELIATHSMISSPGTPTTGTSPPSRLSYRPLRLLLHLSNPSSDKLLTPNSIDAAKSNFINSLKEADLVRWRNTSRVTGLRRVDLDAGWDGILNDDYDAYMRLASRLIPLPVPPVPAAPSAKQEGAEVAAPSKAESSYAVRALPIKVYLPDGAPMVQDIFPPIGSDGKPSTVLSLLRTHLPLLFPPTTADPYTLAFPLSQGIQLPPDAELAWLSSCMCGADGWLRIAIRLRTGA